MGSAHRGRRLEYRAVPAWVDLHLSLFNLKVVSIVDQRNQISLDKIWGCFHLFGINFLTAWYSKIDRVLDTTLEPKKPLTKSLYWCLSSSEMWKMFKSSFQEICYDTYKLLILCCLKIVCTLEPKYCAEQLSEAFF